MRLSPTARILVVATRDLQEPIGQSLRHGGYAYSCTNSCTDAVRSLEDSSPDVVVLHAPLATGRTGASLLRQAETRGIPVLTVGRPGRPDEAGHVRRDLSRINALLASHLGVDPNDEQTAADGVVAVGEVAADAVHHVASVADRPLDLTQKEFALLCHLLRRPGWTWTRQQLLRQVWGYDLADPRIVTVHIGNLRKKLALAALESSHASRTQPVLREAFIQTVKGVGYRFARPEQTGCGGEMAPVSARPRRKVGRPPRSPFVGRDREMAILRQSLEEALAGRVQTAVLVGDAGIGKTRVAEEFSAYARGTGTTVLWGRCHEKPAGPAYAPWMEIFEQWDREHDRDDLAVLFSPRSPDSGTTHRKGQRARFLFLEKLTAAVRARTEEMPTCFVLDNLHQADTSTLLVVQHVVRHLREAPLMVVLTYRPFEVGAHLLLTDITAEIACSESGSILPLAPLTKREVERFVQECGKADPSAGRLDGQSSEIFELTEGNPLYLTQLTRLLLLRSDDPEFRVSSLDLAREEGVRSVILHRLSHISPACREWLGIAAVFGREFTGTLAGESIGLAPDLLSRVAAEAVETHLVVPREDAPERYRFAHSLVREVIYDALPLGHRADLHALAATALERRYAGELDLHSAVLAHHYSAAVAAGCAQKAVEYCAQAGRVAASRDAWEEACAHWERALALLELLPADAEERSSPFAAQLYEDLGDSYGSTGETDRAIEAYDHAARHLPRTESVGLARIKRKQAEHLQIRTNGGWELDSDFFA